MVKHSNGTSVNTVQPNRKWIIQDGGLNTLNAYSSAPRLDKYEIPTTTANMYQGSSNPLEPKGKLYKQTGSVKIQDGGIQTSNACISASRQDINEIPTAIPMFLRSSFPMGLMRIL